MLEDDERMNKVKTGGRKGIQLVDRQQARRAGTEFITVFLRTFQHTGRDVDTNHGVRTSSERNDKSTDPATVVEHSFGLKLGLNAGVNDAINMLDVMLAAIEEVLERIIIQIFIQEFRVAQNAKIRVVLPPDLPILI